MNRTTWLRGERRAGWGLRVLLPFAALLGVAAPGASAETADKKFAVESAGRTTCAQYTEARSSNPSKAARYIGFIEGYLTAANRYEPNTFDLTPWHTTSAFALILDQHCKRTPEDGLAMVAQKLVVSMMPLRLADSSPLVELREGENRAVVYERILWRAQGELARRGLYRARPDGKDSPEFRSALTQFQKLSKLDPSGVPDVATLWVLLNP
ncbi:peptidoglycan-binding domain-containing protein [Erythrobacter sp. THAF29]|uniref:peptidoglycan-binding domain-containing protein n=1 Tax=Erythrobacter sp. THAF29 TaxID=2587851 RepID=UPI0012691692|nr:peptidoglycan-binding domain-containing protein [Erythrobacter sp. THAF29]QFT76462.1 Putative peptidoglycan binding domain protein [Erythrobacter sp. THAF29]